MSYIDDVASRIVELSSGDPKTFRILTPEYLQLYRHYAALCLAKGTATTRRDVHDVWSAWRLAEASDHDCAVPFEDLPLKVRAMDAKYRDAIVAVARERE